MGLTTEKKETIVHLLKKSITEKFNKYSPETINMPFHYRLLGKDRMALYSFIHSLITTFGTSIYEPVAVELSKERFKNAELKYSPYNFISSNAHRTIQLIIDDISTTSREPNKIIELEEIRSECKSGKLDKVRLTKVDLFLKGSGDEIYLTDIKTAKPNMGQFKEFKRTLLEWAAAEMTRNPEVKVSTFVSIPYNPYEPKPYDRWTMRGMFDLTEEIKVADDFWNFLGGEGAYDDLLNCFEIAGIELRQQMDSFFSRFK